MIPFTYTILFIIGTMLCILAGGIVDDIRNETGTWKYKTMLSVFFLAVSGLGINMLLAGLSSVFGGTMHHHEIATGFMMMALYSGLAIPGYYLAKNRRCAR